MVALLWATPHLAVLLTEYVANFDMRGWLEPQDAARISRILT